MHPKRSSVDDRASCTGQKRMHYWKTTHWRDSAEQTALILIDDPVAEQLVQQHCRM